MASCKNDFLCILVIKGSNNCNLWWILRSPEKKFTLKIPATAILQCRTLLRWEKAAFFSFVFFPRAQHCTRYIFWDTIGTQCYGGLINIPLAGGTVLWFVTLQAHTCTSYKCHEKLCKTEQTWRTHKSDKCTYIYHQKLHCTVLI